MLYELIALALQTDSTRIATLEIGGDFLPQDLGIDKSYHGLSHHGNDEAAIKHLLALETYQIRHFGKFLTRLAKTSGIQTPTRADLNRLDRKRQRIERRLARSWLGSHADSSPKSAMPIPMIA